MRSAPPVVLAITLAALAAACGSESDSPETFHEVLDSAGVRIVVNGPDAPARAEFSADPLLELPAASRDDVSLYRVEGGLLLSGGGFVLANSGNHEVLYFGPDGAFERRFGREGDGPGEFRAITWMEATADGGVTLADSRNRRLTTLGPDGMLARERRFAPPFDEGALPSTAITAAGFAVSALSDGRVIGFPRAFALPSGSRGPLPLQGDFAVYPADSCPPTPRSRSGAARSSSGTRIPASRASPSPASFRDRGSGGEGIRVGSRSRSLRPRASRSSTRANSTS
jgi:hypothetical protein